MKKLKEIFKGKYGKKLGVLMTLSVISVMFSVVGYCDATTPTSLLNDSSMNIFRDFAADIVPTVLAILVIVIPAGLTVWVLPFGVKKGIAFLKKQASRAI